MSESVPDYFGALTGWRKFNLRDRNRVLVSANLPMPWLSADGGEAICIPQAASYIEHNDTPALSCTCGFYSYKTKADALQHAQGTVLAQVEVWGRIVEHARGYRSARMKITAISVPPGFDQIAALEKRYACPVTQETLWISGNPNASSSSNPLANLPPFPSLGQWIYPQWNYLPNSLSASPNVSSQSQWNAQMAQFQHNYQQSFAVMQAQLANLNVRTPYSSLLGSGVVSGFVSGHGCSAIMTPQSVVRMRKSLAFTWFDEAEDDDSKARYAEWKAAWTDPKQPKA